MVEQSEIVIGLEVHVQLETDSKLFCRCENEFGAKPNQNTCPVCMGLPGVLPVLNERAVKYALLAARALNCSIRSRSKFDRKNYYYPDLPKAYQISQYDMPIAEEGSLPVSWSDGDGTVRVERVHLEEDAGKLIHAKSGNDSYVDYNRAGTPLIEIVTGPDISSSEEAGAYLRTLKRRMEYLGISDCNMEEGSLRCDANLSIRNPDGSLGVKTEVKNMNSFTAVESALKYEADRQRRKLDRDEDIQQGTRLWDEDDEKTLEMRTKEEEHDYRYFPEPDLVPLTVDSGLIDEIDDELPEMPDHRFERFRDDFSLSGDDANLVTDSKQMADFFENALDDSVSPQQICNLIKSDILRELNDHGWSISDAKIDPDDLRKVAEYRGDDVISSNGASELITVLISEGGDPDELIESRDLKQISDSDAISDVLDEVIEENPDAVDDVKSGKDQAIGFLMGQVMQKTNGQANPEQANEMLRERIQN